MIEKLAHFSRERIHEQIVHAKEAGAGSYFEVIKDLTITQTQNFSQKWKTNRSVREVFHGSCEKGSADAERDLRGFAVKFYTAECNYDVVALAVLKTLKV